MVTKHFFKILALFVVMIAIGLGVLFYTKYQEGGQAPDVNNKTQLAK